MAIKTRLTTPKTHYRAVIVCGLVLIGLCQPVWALTPVTLQLRWLHQFQFVGYYAALHQGFYREAGLEVTLKEGRPGLDPVAAVLSGQADFGISVSSLVIDYLKGKPVVMLGPVFQHSPNVLVAHGQDTRLVDLVKPASKIALMGGDQDVELKAMFVNEGIALNRLHFVPDAQHLDDFISGRVAAVNAYISNEPYILSQYGVAHTVLRPLTYGMDFYGDVLFTRQAVLTNKPDAVAAFRAASIRGWQYAFDHIPEMIDLILHRYNTQNKTRSHLEYEALALQNLVNPDLIAIGHSNPGRWLNIAKTYERFGLVQIDRPLDAFFYEPERSIDLTWLYWTLAIFLIVAVVIVGIALYIHRVNRQLALALEEKSRSEERHRIIFQTSASAGVVWREGFIVTDWNRQAEVIFGWTRHEVLGKSFIDFLLPPTARESLAQQFSQLVRNRALPHSINQNLTRDGRVITCEWFNAWLPDRSGEPYEVVSLANDISERQRLEEEIRQLAFFDPLTQLPNRRLLKDRLTHLLAALRRYGKQGALMFLDLDNFKPLNDLHGHDVGDLLLIEVARRLTECVRNIDTIARFGGDEFVVLIGGLDADAQQQAQQVAHKILTQLAQPYHLARAEDAATIEHRCSASIGVALLNGKTNEEDALRRADTAMYRAKESGRNCVAVDTQVFGTTPIDTAEHIAHRRIQLNLELLQHPHGSTL